MQFKVDMMMLDDAHTTSSCLGLLMVILDIPLINGNILPKLTAHYQYTIADTQG